MTGLCSTQGGGGGSSATNTLHRVRASGQRKSSVVGIGLCHRVPLPKNKISITAAAKAMTSSLLVVSLMEVVSLCEAAGPMLGSHSLKKTSIRKHTISHNSQVLFTGGKKHFVLITSRRISAPHPSCYPHRYPQRAALPVQQRGSCDCGCPQQFVSRFAPTLQTPVRHVPA